MICFAWSGFPQYAARCVGAFVRTTKERVNVVATRPRVPVEGMEKLAGCEVKWLDGGESGLADICGEMPRVLFVSGWGFPVFNRFRDEVRRGGGKIVAMVDNNFVFSFREIIKAFRFRLLLRRKFDGYLVPGASGRRLLCSYGVGGKKISSGMYSADEELFSNGAELPRRQKKILFVGQLNGRKNIVPFAQAFLKANEKREWQLEICGCGPLKGEIPVDETIAVHDFVQPEQLAGIYRSARVFALPSQEEHWGLVVHEAALSGCILLLSNQVGAAADLLGKKNGRMFNPHSIVAMEESLRCVMSLTVDELKEAQGESLQLARRISKQLFVDGVRRFADEC